MVQSIGVSGMCGCVRLCMESRMWGCWTLHGVSGMSVCWTLHGVSGMCGGAKLCVEPVKCV